MNVVFSVLVGSFRAEVLHLMRARLFVALTIIQAVTFLFLVSLFGLTGSHAPTALVTQDTGPYARAFISQLASTYNSFDLRPMDASSAMAALHRGSLVAIITLPNNFSFALSQGLPITLHVAVDNVNTDMTDDIQRALPSAIVAFGRQHHLPGIRVQGAEIDLIDHDTGFIPYLVVSALALDAFIIASILSAMAVAREFETKTIKLLAVAPVHPLLPILGRMLATDTIAAIAMLFPVALAVFAYHIIPLYPLEAFGVLLLCIVIFGCIGVAIGAVLRQTLPVVSLIFGLGFPLYLSSGSLEPQRFDGNLIWMIAHISPVYYAVGILEQAFHGLQVTPEPQWVNFSALFSWALFTLLLAAILLRATLIEQTAIRHMTQEQPIVANNSFPHHQLRTVPHPRWVFSGLVLLALGGEIWFSEYQHQAQALQLQQQQIASADDQRETLVLNDYTQRMSSMLAQDIQNVKITDSMRAVASALTQKTLLQLNPVHKVALLRYLHTRKLIDDDFHVVNLQEADFQGCNLTGLDLSDTDMTGANFSNANMRNVKLTSSTLVSVNFHGANLLHADIRDADMQDADISNANLAGADLAGVVGKSIEQLLPARSLAGARLPDGSVQPGEVLDTD